MTTLPFRSILACGAMLLMAACASAKRPALQDLNGSEDLALFKLGPVSGVRDGDRLEVHTLVTDSSSMLTVDMHFAVGSPTRLDSGAWHWTRSNRLTEGTVTARSVTFLGGQDGPPSIGGTFDLVGPDGLARYRLNMPLTQLTRRNIR